MHYAVLLVGHKRLHSDPDSSLDAVSKRLRPDLALRLGPDPELSTRASQHGQYIMQYSRYTILSLNEVSVLYSSKLSFSYNYAGSQLYARSYVLFLYIMYTKK